MVVPFHIPTSSVCKNVPSFSPTVGMVVRELGMVPILLELQVSLMVILIQISLITNDVEHLLMCLFSIFISSDPIIPLFFWISKEIKCSYKDMDPCYRLNCIPAKFIG